MSKTYWLITSNSIPTPEKKEKTLILHGVNAYEVKELLKVNDSPIIFQLSETNLNEQTSYFKKLSFREKLNLYAKVYSKLNKSLKLATFVISIYLALFFFIATYFSTDYSICIAFISTVATGITSLFKLFNEEKVYGSLIALLISIGIGLLIYPIYSFLIDNYFCSVVFLQKDRIGNFLTVLSMFICFLGYLKTVLNSLISEIPNNTQ